MNKLILISHTILNAFFLNSRIEKGLEEEDMAAIKDELVWHSGLSFVGLAIILLLGMKDFNFFSQFYFFMTIHTIFSLFTFFYTLNSKSSAWLSVVFEFSSIFIIVFTGIYQNFKNKKIDNSQKKVTEVKQTEVKQTEQKLVSFGKRKLK